MRHLPHTFHRAPRLVATDRDDRPNQVTMTSESDPETTEPDPETREMIDPHCATGWTRGQLENARERYDAARRETHDAPRVDENVEDDRSDIDASTPTPGAVREDIDPYNPFGYSRETTRRLRADFAERLNRAATGSHRFAPSSPERSTEANDVNEEDEARESSDARRRASSSDEGDR